MGHAPLVDRFETSVRTALNVFARYYAPVPGCPQALPDAEPRLTQPQP